jgi:hypothetical protein
MLPSLEEKELMQFFEFNHLPPYLQVISAPFGKLANNLLGDLPSNFQRRDALKKLIEAKDCAVRSLLVRS